MFWLFDSWYVLIVRYLTDMVWLFDTYHSHLFFHCLILLSHVLIDRNISARIMNHFKFSKHHWFLLLLLKLVHCGYLLQLIYETLIHRKRLYKRLCLARRHTYWISVIQQLSSAINEKCFQFSHVNTFSQVLSNSLCDKLQEICKISTRNVAHTEHISCFNIDLEKTDLNGD